MIQFKLENGFKLDLEKSEKVFTPTGTTEAIIEAILENNNQKKKYFRFRMWMWSNWIVVIQKWFSKRTIICL